MGLEDSKASVEQLRDASSQGGMREPRLMQSGNRMEPARSLILEEDTRGSQYMTDILEEAATKETEGDLTGVSSQTGGEKKFEAVLEEKVMQIEMMTKILNDREEQRDNLNDT